MCSYIYNKFPQHCVLLKDSNPGISTQGPSRVNVLILSVTVQNQALACYKPLTCQTSEKYRNWFSAQIRPQPHPCTGLQWLLWIWNIPLEKPGLLFELYTSHQTKSFPIIWRNLLNPLCKISVTSWKRFRNPVQRELEVVEVLFLLHQEKYKCSLQHSDFKAHWGLGIASLFICSGPVLENDISLLKPVAISIIKPRLCKCRELWKNIIGEHVVLKFIWTTQIQLNWHYSHFPVLVNTGLQPSTRHFRPKGGF